MAVSQRLVRPMNFVGTDAQRYLVETDADRLRVSLGEIVRAAIDRAYDLVDGEFRDDDSRIDEFTLWLVRKEWGDLPREGRPTLEEFQARRVEQRA